MRYIYMSLITLSMIDLNQLNSKSLCDNKDSYMKSIIFKIDGIHCAGCVSKIQNSFSQKYAINIQVNVVNGLASLTFNPSKLSVSKIFEHIKSLGYMPKLLENEFDEEQFDLKKKQAMWRWALAGICMMQIMMLSMPSYLEDLSELREYQNLFAWGQWVLTLPVFFFSASEILINAYKDLINRTISMDLPVSLGILLMFIFSSLATFDSNGVWGRHVYFDSISMFLFFLLTARWVELKMKDKMLKSINHVIDVSLKEARLVQGSKETSIPLQEIKINDVLRIPVGETIPLDGIVAEGETTCDESLISGESIPVKKIKNDFVISGSVNLSKDFCMQVTHDFNQSKLMQISNVIQQSLLEKPAIVKMIDRLAKPFLMFVILLASLTFLINWSLSPEKAIMSMVAVLVVTCPCALTLATPIALMAASARLFNEGIYIKNLSVLEKIKQTKHIIFDKTGTLTTTQKGVTKVLWIAKENKKIIDLVFSLTFYSRHPFSIAIHEFFSSKGQLLKLDNLKEFHGEGIEASYNNEKYRLGSYQFCAQLNPKLAKDDVAQTYIVSSKNVLANFVIAESAKQNLGLLLSFLNQQKIKLHLFSGDKLKNINKVINYSFLKINALMRPEEKLTAMQAIQKNNPVMMIGDGFNDGPALSKADISICMNHSPQMVKNASDLLLISDDMLSIKSLFLVSQKAIFIVRQNIFWALAYNFLMIPLAFMGFIYPWVAGLGMSISSLVVVFNSLRIMQR